MKKIIFSLALVFASTSFASEPPALNAPDEFVSNTQEFERFIHSQPTIEEFKEKYPKVTLVLPGSITTKEFRMNNSRFFAEFNEKKKIVSGRFQ